MADQFDAYREALVMETNTVWPDSIEGVEGAERERLETKLHAVPDQCAHIEYVRVHSGFCRLITVTEQDLQRVRLAK